MRYIANIVSILFNVAPMNKTIALLRNHFINLSFL